MTEKEKLIKEIKNEKSLPFYIRMSEIDLLKDEENEFFDIPSNNNSYQTKKHNHNSLYKPIILLNEKI